MNMRTQSNESLAEIKIIYFGKLKAVLNSIKIMPTKKH